MLVTQSSSDNVVNSVFKVECAIVKCNSIDEDHEKYRKAEYVQRRVCFVNVQSSLHENVALLFERAWAMPHKLHLSCGIPFLVWMPAIISCLTSVVV